MNLTAQIAKHFREVLFGGNWTESTLKDHISGVTWEQATKQVGSLNTIAMLVYHMNYYVVAALKVLENRDLDSHDKDSFACPPIRSQEDWEKLLDKTWSDAEKFATLVEQLPDSKLEETFAKEKYGNYYRNIHGIIEHYHYHLGQIVLLKKLTQSEKFIM